MDGFPQSNLGHNGLKNRSKETGISSDREPKITLPKGGGAIQGMGEKFQVNPVTGTGV